MEIEKLKTIDTPLLRPTVLKDTDWDGSEVLNAADINAHQRAVDSQLGRFSELAKVGALGDDIEELLVLSLRAHQATVDNLKHALYVVRKNKRRDREDVL